MSAKVFGIDEGAENEDTNDVTWERLGMGTKIPPGLYRIRGTVQSRAKSGCSEAVVVAVLSFPTA